MTAVRVPSRISELAPDQTDATISVGAGGVSGDFILDVNGSESARLIFGAVGPPDTRGTFLFNHGDAQGVTAYGVTTGRWLDIRHGYTATPDTGYAPTVKISRTLRHAAVMCVGGDSGATINVTDATGFAASGTAYLVVSQGAAPVAFTYTGKTATSLTGCSAHAATTSASLVADFPIVGDGAEQLAGLSVQVYGVDHSGVQPVAGAFGAFSDSTSPAGASGQTVSPDACAVYGVGEVRAGGTGVAMGGCFVARRIDTAAYALTAQQVFVKNSSSADQAYNPTGVSDCAFWINSNGTKNAGAALIIRNSGAKFDVGIAFQANSINSAAFRDDSSSATSIVINGSHSGYGIDLAGATITGAAIRVANLKSLASRNAAGDADKTLIYLNGSDSLVLGSSASLITIDQSAAAAGINIGTGPNQKVGFYGATPVVQQASTVGLGTVLSNLGLRAAGTNYTLTTSGAVTFTGGLTLNTVGVTITDVDIVLGTTTGTKIGTATNQKIGFWNATPVVQPSATTELFASLNALGLIPSGATPITTTGLITAGGGIDLSAKNIATDTSTGTKIGTTATQLLAFWNGNPMARPSTSVTASSFTANSGTAVNDASTFDGYTIKQIVHGLRLMGLFA